jgi:tRNA modification GTPase
VGIVRLSGPLSPAILARVFRPRAAEKMRPRRLVLGRIIEPGRGALVDEALAVWFPAPHSFTGEDCVEIQGHGGAAAQLILEAVLAAGAVMAAPGEFTRRAFLNGRMDLSQAEAVAELIAARGRAEAKLAAGRLAGGLRDRLAPAREAILSALAELEAAIDFSDELGEVDLDGLRRKVEAGAARPIEALLADGRSGRLFRDGLKLALAGSPNVGKSSLFNALTGGDRAMVSEIPGTTRDYLTAEAAWAGLAVELYDTAGLSEAPRDELEADGQERARARIAEADIVLWVLDASRRAYDGGGLFPNPELALKERTVVVWNKVDLAPAPAPGEEGYAQTAVSAKTGAGLKELKELILRLALGHADFAPPQIVPNARQFEALAAAGGRLGDFFQAASSGQPPDICALELKAALDALEVICGRTTPEDVLDKIFSRFCLGK